MEYFILPIYWNTLTLFLIYYSNDDDGLVLTPDRKIITSPTEADARAVAQKRKLELQDTMEPLDLKTIQGWVNSRSTRVPEANLVYRVWNFLGDAASSLKQANQYLGYNEAYISLHDELFWGCNMPGLTQSQELYELDLSQSEIRNLRLILRSGLEIFQQALQQ